MRIPVAFEAEYRGEAPGGEFVNRNTGEEIAYGPKLKLEVDLPDGDVEVIVVALKQLDDAADFDATQLKKGDRIWIEGTVQEATYDGVKSIRFRPMVVRRKGAQPAVKAA